jgi:hypothetical protein
MIYRLVLRVLLDGLRRHQEQYVCTTALSEKWFYCLLERDRNAGPIPIPTGVGVTCSLARDVLDRKALLLSV